MTTIEIMNATPERLDDATRRVTMYASWAEMVADLRRGSYTPTLRDDDAAAPEQADKDAVRVLRFHLDREGLRHYSG